MEYRLIRYAVSQTMKALKEQKRLVDPESDVSVDITNDLLIYKSTKLPRCS